LLSVEGLRDIDASDWQNFGRGTAEGRIRLNLEKGNAPSGVHPGVRIGYEWESIIPVLFEGGLFPGKVTLLTLGLGVDARLFHNDTFAFCLVPKVGYSLGFMSLGTAEVLPGKTPPIITPEGTFNQGDSVSASIGGFFAQAGIALGVKLSRRVGLRLDGGYQLAFLNSFSVTAGDVTLDQGSEALVLPGTATAARLDPKAKASGPYALLALTLDL
jgi:hypothetical protein